MKARIITSVIGIPIILGILVSSIFMKILVLLIMLSSSYELFEMRKIKERRYIILGLLISIGVFFLVIFFNISFVANLIGALSFISFVLLIYLIFNNWGYRGKQLKSYNSINGKLSVVLIAIFYFSLLLCHLILLRNMEDGLKLLIYILSVTFSVDTGSYFIGSLIGKRRDTWLTVISPNKTIEGFLGGLLVGFLISFLLSKLMGINYDLVTIIVVSSLVPFFAILGDLLQSALKRLFNVKNSGVSLHGHGGFLDRVDSLSLSATSYYWILVMAL